LNLLGVSVFAKQACTVADTLALSDAALGSRKPLNARLCGGSLSPTSDQVMGMLKPNIFARESVVVC
jgi:hypothetical protein